MIARLVAALFVAILVAALPLPAAGEEKSPLTVSIAVDPLLRDRFKSQEELEAHLLELLNRASLIFNADVGRRFVPGVVEIGLPPNTGFSIDDKNAFAWLAEKLKRRPSRFWVFLIDRPLTSCNIPGVWGGCGMMNDPRSIVAYNSDLPFSFLRCHAAALPLAAIQGSAAPHFLELGVHKTGSQLDLDRHRSLIGDAERHRPLVTRRDVACPQKKA